MDNFDHVPLPIPRIAPGPLDAEIIKEASEPRLENLTFVCSRIQYAARSMSREHRYRALLIANEISAQIRELTRFTTLEPWMRAQLGEDSVDPREVEGHDLPRTRARLLRELLAWAEQ